MRSLIYLLCDVVVYAHLFRVGRYFKRYYGLALVLLLSFLILQFMLLFQVIKQDVKVRIGKCCLLPLDYDACLLVMVLPTTCHHMGVFAKWQKLVVDSSHSVILPNSTSVVFLNLDSIRRQKATFSN